jgi:hypothetical protein
MRKVVWLQVEEKPPCRDTAGSSPGDGVGPRYKPPGAIRGFGRQYVNGVSLTIPLRSNAHRLAWRLFVVAFRFHGRPVSTIASIC